jgi:hypothetical protein
LFGHPEGDHFSLDESRNHDIPQVSTEQNETWIVVFTEKEVKEAIFQMKHNKAPGPDGFPIDFTKFFGKSLKET